MGKRCQVCDGPIVNGRCKYCGMPYRNDMELYHLNEDRSEHYRHASAKVKKAMAENEIPLSDRNKTVPKAAKTSSARTQTIRTQNTKVQTSRIQTSGTKKTSGQSYSAQTARTYSTGKKTAKSEKKKSGKSGLSLPKDGLDVGEIAGTVRDFLSDLTDRLRISRLRARVVVGTDDAAQTGILLGQTAALCGIIVPFLENTFDMQDYHVSADADFNADHTEWAFTVNCSIRPISLVRVLLRHGKPMYKLYKKYFK